MGVRAAETMMIGSLMFMPFTSGNCEVTAELLAQRSLQDLAGGGMGNLTHRHHVVGKPPLRHFVGQKFDQVLFARWMGGVARYNDQKRTLIPLGVVHADDRRLRDGRMADRRIFEVDGGY